MFKIKKYILLLILGFLFGSCAKPPQQLSSLQLQQIQRREYNTSKNLAFGAVLSVLQDNQYIIDNADKDTGLITASSSSFSGGDQSLFTRIMFGKDPVVGSKMKLNASVESVDLSRVLIRLNYVVSISVDGITDSIVSGNTANSASFYNYMHEKIAEAIFIRHKSLGIK